MKTLRWFAIFMGVAGLAISIVIAIIWWNERALDSVQDRLATGDAAGALAAAENYLATHPGHSHALALRARALVALGRVQDAAHVFDQAGAANPDDLRAWSTALLYLGDWQHALPILERLLQVEPANPETLEAITVCQFEMGRQQDAIQTAQRLAQLPGHEATGHLQLASIYRAGGHAMIANQHFQKVLQYRSDATGLEMAPAEFFLAYGESLLLSGDARQALDLLERSGQLESNQSVLLRQGEAWQTMGNYEKARELLDRIVRQNPDNRVARERLAEIALQQNDATTALGWLKHLLDHDWTTANMAYLLQRAYTSLGEESLAQQWQEKTVALRRTERQLAALQREVRKDPESPRARLIAAYQSAVDGNWKTAGRLLAALLRQAPDSYAETFVQHLAVAIRQRGKLPPIESMPSTNWLPKSNPSAQPNRR